MQQGVDTNQFNIRIGIKVAAGAEIFGGVPALLPTKLEIVVQWIHAGGVDIRIGSEIELNIEKIIWVTSFPPAKGTALLSSNCQPTPAKEERATIILQPMRLWLFHAILASERATASRCKLGTRQAGIDR